MVAKIQGKRWYIFQLFRLPAAMDLLDKGLESFPHTAHESREVITLTFVQGFYKSGNGDIVQCLAVRHLPMVVFYR